MEPQGIYVTELDGATDAAFAKSFDRSLYSGSPALLDCETVPNREKIHTIVITVRSPIDAQCIAMFPGLRLISTMSTGTDHIDVKEARRRGISVCNVPEYGAAVAEFNIALLLLLSRKIVPAIAQTTQKDFSLHGLLGSNLFGKTLGIIGTGNIGLRVARLARSFGMQVLATDPVPSQEPGLSYVDLTTLLSNSQFIAVCCPLNESTHNLIGREQFAKMQKGVFLVNTSRGAVVDAQALLWALNEEIVAGAALDVLEGEILLPVDQLTAKLAGSPTFEETQTIAEDLTLMRHPKVIVTPHMAFYTEDSLSRIREVTVSNIENYWSGNPQNCVEIISD